MDDIKDELTSNLAYISETSSPSSEMGNFKIFILITLVAVLLYRCFLAPLNRLVLTKPNNNNNNNT